MAVEYHAGILLSIEMRVYTHVLLTLFFYMLILETVKLYERNCFLHKGVTHAGRNSYPKTEKKY